MLRSTNSNSSPKGPPPHSVRTLNAVPSLSPGRSLVGSIGRQAGPWSETARRSLPSPRMSQGCGQKNERGRQQTDSQVSAGPSVRLSVPLALALLACRAPQSNATHGGRISTLSRRRAGQSGRRRVRPVPAQSPGPEAQCLPACSFLPRSLARPSVRGASQPAQRYWQTDRQTDRPTEGRPLESERRVAGEARQAEIGYIDSRWRLGRGVAWRWAWRQLIQMDGYDGSGNASPDAQMLHAHRQWQTVTAAAAATAAAATSYSSDNSDNSDLLLCPALWTWPILTGQARAAGKAHAHCTHARSPHAHRPSTSGEESKSTSVQFNRQGRLSRPVDRTPRPAPPRPVCNRQLPLTRQRRLAPPRLSLSHATATTAPHTRRSPSR